jgi:hypothetical protein
MYEPGGFYANLDELFRERQILHSLTYRRSQNESTIQKQRKEWWLSRAEGREKCRGVSQSIQSLILQDG